MSDAEKNHFKLQIRAIQGGSPKITTSHYTESDAYINAPIQLKDYVAQEIKRIQPETEGAYLWEVEVESRKNNYNHLWRNDKVLEDINEKVPEEDQAEVLTYLAQFEELDLAFNHLGVPTIHVMRVYADDGVSAGQAAVSRISGGYENRVISVNPYTPKKK